MPNFFDSMKDKVDNVFDKAQDFLGDKIVEKLRPPVHQTIDGRVDQFRDDTLTTLPQTCEDKLREASDDSAVAWFFNKFVGDNTDVLVGKILEKMRPNIVQLTDGLSTNATDLIMERVRSLVDDDDDSDKEGGDAQEDPEYRPSELKLEPRMPKWEASTRQLVHPLFDRLRGEIWEQVPPVVRAAVAEMLQDDPDEVENQLQDNGENEEERGNAVQNWFDKTGDWFQAKAAHTADRCVTIGLTRMEEPARALIDRLVAELEDTSMDYSMAEVKRKLSEYGLAKGPPSQDS